MYFSKQFLNQLYKLGFLLVVVLVLLDLLVYFYYADVGIANLFLATREQTPLTWVSAAALLVIALVCMSAYYRHKRKIWYFLAIIFFFFSMDDAVFFHERFSGFLNDHIKFLGEIPTYVWAVIYLPLLLFALGATVYLLWQQADQRIKKWVVIAVLLLGLAITLDLIDGYVQKKDEIVFCIENSCHQSVEHIMRLIEEVIEVIALGIMGYFLAERYTLLDKNKK